MRNEAVKLLNEAYLPMAKRIESGHRTLPTRFESIWEMVKRGYEAIQVVGEDECYDMYKVCYYAAEEYTKTVAHIGVDNAFSTIICEMGIQCYGAKWYRIMAYHYLQQAERIVRGEPEDFEPHQ